MRPSQAGFTGTPSAYRSTVGPEGAGAASSGGGAGDGTGCGAALSFTSSATVNRELKDCQAPSTTSRNPSAVRKIRLRFGLRGCSGV
ncbi:hypothetical protein [Streptomyces sp. NBC_01446]|uniref:hypothetical protein n=1 Tax=Streptomyces sp. NBC_01446 TaxID=2903870 RepID=UPI00225BF98A|nr:hypothetical protein [Streptomyces sp. NBC_01446]MCX4647291.1 hypothetical protein [Streptomyces sp. NBC_01446]